MSSCVVNWQREKELNHSMLIKIMSSIRFLARQGLALRGDGNEDDLWQFFPSASSKSRERLQSKCLVGKKNQ